LVSGDSLFGEVGDEFVPGRAKTNDFNSGH